MNTEPKQNPTLTSETAWRALALARRTIRESPDLSAQILRLDRAAKTNPAAAAALRELLQQLIDAAAIAAAAEKKEREKRGTP